MTVPALAAAEVNRITFGGSVMELDAGAPRWNRALARHFSHARVAADAADWRIRLDVVPGALPAVSAGTPYRLETSSHRFDFGPGLVWGEVAPGGDVAATMVAELLAPAHIFLFDRFVCHLLFTVAVGECPLLIHGAALAERGRGAILFGPPGAGKSTAAALAHEALRLHDDLAVVHRSEGKRLLSGAPFDPRERAFDGGHADLAVICSLHHARDVRIERGDARALVRRLLPETFLPLPLAGGNRQDSFARLVVAVRALAETVPYYQLHFRPDQSFWPALRPVLTQETP